MVTSFTCTYLECLRYTCVATCTLTTLLPFHILSHIFIPHLLTLPPSSFPVHIVLLRKCSSKKRSNYPTFTLPVLWSLPPPKHQFPSLKKKMSTRVMLKCKQMLIVDSDLVQCIIYVHYELLFCESNLTTTISSDLVVEHVFESL